MIEPRWDQPRPTPDEIRALWESDPFTWVDFSSPPLDALLASFRQTHARGGAVFGMCAFPNHPAIHWFLSRNQPEQIRFRENFLSSPAVRAALPELESPVTPAALGWDYLSAYMLAGDFATALVHGGAYQDFPGTGRDAKNMAEAACDSLFGDRFEDLRVYTTDAWSPWFRRMTSDRTWVGIDLAELKVWLLCLTDTD